MENVINFYTLKNSLTNDFTDGLIKLKADAGLDATEADIAENPKKFVFKALEAAQLPRTLQDVDASIINGNYALESKLNPVNDSILLEGADSPYANIVTVVEGHENDEKIKVILDVLDGLEYLHNKGLVHRDIKPENILLFNGVYKISDFGLIKNLAPNAHPNDVMSAIGLCLGTTRYMAPEVEEAAHYSHLSDIFALGVVMSQLHITELASIANKCTSQTVRFRYQSIAEIRNDILRVIK